MGIINVALSFIKELFGKFVNIIQDVLPVDGAIAQYIAYGAIGLVVLLLVLIIVLCCVSGKKRKAKKLANKQEETANEETKVEEAVEEEVEQTVKEEKQPVVEEKVEETPVVKEKAKPVAKKTVKKPVEKAVEEKVEEPVVETKTSRIAIGKYEVFPVNDVFLYRLKASNGEIMVTSEIYKTSKGAVSAIETVKKNVETGTLQVYEDKHGLYQFKLFAANKRLLVVSANYTSEASCTNAANSFKRFATISPVVILEEDVDHLMEEISLDALSDKKGGKLTINAVNDEFDFKLLASNGVVLCTSSECKTKAAVLNSINSVKEAIKNGKFFVVKDKRGTFQFKLYSALGRCVLVGEAYKNKAQAMSAANSVASFMTLSTIVDKTVEEVNN